MKKFISICLVLFLILPCFALFCACGEQEKKYLEIVGDFQTTYYLDEEPDFSKIKVKYTYEDGRQVDISLKKDMISNLNTKTVGAKTLTISYLGKSLNVDYSVINLKYANFVCRRKTNGGSDVEIDTAENYVFSRDGSLSVTIGEDAYSGTYTVFDNGSLQLSYKKADSADIFVVNFVKVNFGKYKSESLIDGYYKILDAVV